MKNALGVSLSKRNQGTTNSTLIYTSELILCSTICVHNPTRGQHSYVPWGRVLYPGQIGIWRCLFLWREENLRTRRKTLGERREPTRNLTQKHGTGIEPWPAEQLSGLTPEEGEMRYKNVERDHLH